MELIREELHIEGTEKIQSCLDVIGPRVMRSHAHAVYGTTYCNHNLDLHVYIMASILSINV